MVGLDSVEQAGVGRGKELAGSVGEVDGGLLDLLTETGEGEDAKAVADDANEALGTQFRREAPRVVERVEDEGRELEDAAVGVVEPRTGGEGEDGGRALDGYASELDGTRPEEAGDAAVSAGIAARERNSATHRVRVSPRLPVSGSRTVRSKTPLFRPMLTNIVAWYLSMLASVISAITIEDGGAVRACGDAR